MDQPAFREGESPALCYSLTGLLLSVTTPTQAPPSFWVFWSTMLYLHALSCDVHVRHNTDRSPVDWGTKDRVDLCLLLHLHSCLNPGPVVLLPISQRFVFGDVEEAQLIQSEGTSG